MLIATVEKLNGNWYPMNFMDINSLEENIVDNWVQCDTYTQNKYNALKLSYGKVCVKEEDVQAQFINTDSFIFSEAFTSDVDIFEIEKAKLVRSIDYNFNNSLKGIDFMQYINYIALFNYFAGKGIYITQENKEDKYIEILELDDEEAITKLEEYLSVQEMVLPFLDTIKANAAIKEDIEYSSEEEFEALKIQYS